MMSKMKRKRNKKGIDTSETAEPPNSEWLSRMRCRKRIRWNIHHHTSSYSLGWHPLRFVIPPLYSNLLLLFSSPHSDRFLTHSSIPSIIPLSSSSSLASFLFPIIPPLFSLLLSLILTHSISFILSVFFHFSISSPIPPHSFFPFCSLLY